MESCCRPSGGDVRSHEECPQCGERGRRVQRITLKALLRPAALERLAETEYRFCATPACPIVYFGGGGVFDCEDVQVPVFQKSLEGERTVCYCLGISVGLIEREIEALGTSASADRIRELVKADRCACEIRNPEGSCCLGNVGVVLMRLSAGERTTIR